MSILKLIKSKLTYTETTPLFYTSGLQKAYSTTSVTGGNLKSKHVVVTGGSSGIGLAIAKRYINEGCHVTIIGRSKEKLEYALKQLKITSHSTADYEIMDQIDPENIKAGMRDILEKTDVDIWVNCAGVFTGVDKSKRFRDVDEKSYNTVINTNLKGIALICRLLAEHWLDSGKKGHVINIASICGIFPSFGQTPYGISKVEVASLTQQLSLRYKGRILFTCVSPGSVATAMAGKNTGDNIARKGNALIRHTAMPEEIAAVVAFLSSPAGILVNNGRSLFLPGMITASAAEIL